MAPAVEEQLAIVRARLDQLRAADRSVKVFGASSHRYRLAPPYSEAKLKAFERKHGCTLPDDYRAFITTLGNGGAGPSYGVFPFRGGDSEDITKYDVLGKPFPHPGAYNPKELIGDGEDDDEDPDVEYWKAFSSDGTLYICHHGCALRTMLIVSGPQRGEVWNDDTADHGGYVPVLVDGARVGFLAWYLSWLDRSLAALHP